jgi:DNA-directed RNA polymerase
MKRQQEREVDMRQRGFSAAIGKLGDPDAFKGMIRPYINQVTNGVAEECLSYLNRPGSPNAGVRRLLPLDPEKIAAIGLEGCLSAICGRQTILKVALQIGRSLETQHKLEVYEHVHGKRFSWLYQEAVKRSSHKARIRYGLLHAMKLDHVPYTPWSKEESLAAGFLVIHVITQTGLIEVSRVYSKKRHTSYVQGTPLAHQIMLSMMRAKLSSAVQYGPLVCPPVPWNIVEHRWQGGYYTPEIQIPLVKTKSRDFRGRQHSFPMTQHVEAVNHLMGCPFEIDREALGFAAYLYDQKVGTSSMPMERMEIEAYQEGQDLAEWKRKARDAHEWNAKLEGRTLQSYAIIQTAFEYLDEPEVYFAINCDFRGRLNYFTGPSLLNPQGNDLSKSLIRFKQGKSIQGSEKWFLLHGANEFGTKGTIQDRVQWSLDHWEYIVASAMAPMEFTWWMEADSPLQFLRWCREYSQWRNSPDAFLSHIPCQQDGTCNGIQHLAALTRDSRAALAVNLTASTAPQDMYQLVADLVRDKMGSMVDPVDVEMAIMWLRFGFDRNTVKRQCMTKPYGSTQHSCTEYTRQYVSDKLQGGAEDTFGEFKQQATIWMSKLIWDSINDLVTGPQQTMEWLKGVARAYNKAGKVIEWTTPTGFLVHHYYPEWQSRQVKTFIDGQVVKPRIREEKQDSIAANDVVNGISANFIHSLDASHLVRVIRRLKEEGIYSVLAIHDSIGVHAADAETLARVIREEFVAMYTDHDPLRVLIMESEKQGIPIDPPPSMGSFDIREVLQSTYFFS